MTTIVLVAVIGIACLIAGFLAGGLFAAGKINSKYKVRWQEALRLLESGGQITKEQLQGPTEDQPTKVTETPSDDPMKMLRTLPSVYRAQLETERAQKGLPPVDDLTGMASIHVSQVMLARINNQARRVDTPQQ